MTSRQALPWMVLLLATAAVAQDEDLLAPLPLPPKKTRPVPKPRPKAIDAPASGPPSAQVSLTVKVPASLKGARLFLDEQEVGTLPLPAQPLSPGEHVVLVRRQGYADFSKKVMAQPGRPLEVAATLEPVAGFASVNAEVPGAQVIIDGVPVGPVPQNELILPPGIHEIAVRREGFQQDVQVLSVRPGQRYVVQAELTPEPILPIDRPELLAPAPAIAQPSPVEVKKAPVGPLYTRWYFWAATVAAVAAVGVTTAVVVNANQPQAPTYRDVFCGGQPSCAACFGDACP